MRASSLTARLDSALSALTRTDGRLGLAVFVLALLARAVNYDALSDGFFLKYPTLAGMYVVGQGEAARPFTASPLYLFYWIGVAQFLGGSVDAGRVLQIIIGSANCALIAILGKRLFTAAAGLLAGLGSAVYLPFIVHDGSFVSATVVVFLNLCCLLLLERARWGSMLPLLAGGLVLGVSACARPNALILAPFLGWWALRSRPRSDGERPRSRLPAAAAFGLLVIVPPSLISARNYWVSGDFVPVMSDGGIVFYLGNNELDTGLMYHWPRYEELFLVLPGEVDPTHRVAHEIAEREMGRPLKVSEASSFWTGQALSFIRERPLQWLGLVARKVAYTWTGYEAHDVALSFDKEDAIRGRFPWLNFAVVGSLGLVGAFWFRRRFGELLPVYGLLFTYTLTGALFTVVSRYRIPMVPALMWLAGGLLVELWRTAGRRGPRLVILPILAAACLFLLMSYRNYPMRALTAQYRVERDHLGPAEAALRAGRLGEAERHLRAAIERRATFMTTCRAYGFLAELREVAGDTEEAKTYRQIGLGYRIDKAHDGLLLPPEELAGDPVFAKWQAGAQSFRAGQMQQATRQFAGLCNMVPNLAPAHHCYGLALIHAGRTAEGLRRLRLARLKDPSNPATHWALVKFADQPASRLAAEYTHLVAVHGGSMGFRYGYALALQAAGQTAKAEIELNAACSACPALASAMRVFSHNVE